MTMNQGHLRQPHSVKMTANSLSSALARNLMNSFNRLSVRLDLRKFSAIFYTKAGCRRCPQDDTSLISRRGNKHTVALHHPRVMLAPGMILSGNILLFMAMAVATPMSVHADDRVQKTASPFLTRSGPLSPISASSATALTRRTTSPSSGSIPLRTPPLT